MRLRGTFACLTFHVFTTSALFALAQQNQWPDAPTPKLPAQQRPLPNAAPLPPRQQPALGEPLPLPPPPTTPAQSAPRTLTPPKVVADTRHLEDVIRVNVRLVTVPVTVKDRSGRLVDGLQQNDFSVYDNPARPNLQYSSSDPLPLPTALPSYTAVAQRFPQTPQRPDLRGVYFLGSCMQGSGKRSSSRLLVHFPVTLKRKRSLA